MVDAHYREAYADNELAWSGVWEGPPDPQALRWALAAAKATHYHDRSMMQTLATVYTVLDQPDKALDAEVTAAHSAGGYDHPPSYWALTEGLRARDLGLPDLARAAFSRVPRDDTPGCSYLPAQRYLKDLDATPAQVEPTEQFQPP